MLLYHFLNAEYGLDDLRKRRLKISRIMELNDVFEFLGCDLSDRVFRRALRDTKAQLSAEHGILCFSRSWSNPVLWGHYADRQKGLCLGFDVADGFVEPVDYVDSRFPVPAALDQEFMKRLYFTKFSHWKYEEEYRAFVSLDTMVEGHYFMDFSDVLLKLKTVIVGAESAIRRADVADALVGIDAGVETFKSRAAFKSFAIVRNMDDSDVGLTSTGADGA